MQTLRTSLLFSVAVLLATSCWAADAARVEQNPPGYDATVDRIFAREHEFVQSMRQYTPLAETYIQEFKPDNDLGETPTSDHYFMGRLVVGETVSEKSFDK